MKHLPDETATHALGAGLAPLLRTADVICLTGPLGAGKTTLARALIASATSVENAPSPTFSLVETYDGPEFTIWHFDLYRLEHPEDVWELGLEDALEDGVCLIEWPEKIEAMLPQNPLIIALQGDDGARKARLQGRGWDERLAVLTE